MEPPSYEEARLHPAVLPPPAYNASLARPPTPPPTYGQAVVSQPDPFPVLRPPSLSVVETSPHQSNGVIVHPVTQIGDRRHGHRRHTAPVASASVATVVNQPAPVPVRVTALIDSPGLVHCPSCLHIVTSKLSYVPGRAAWCTCCLLAFMGLVCGFCLIPLMMRRMQDVHHSCPRCEYLLHVYRR